MGERLSVHQVAYKVIATWIVIAFFYLFRDYLREVFFHSHQTIQNNFFPALFNNTGFGVAVFAGVFFLAIAAICSEQPLLLTVFPGCLFAGSFLLMIHQKGFCIQAFVTTFWAAIPLYWLDRAQQGEPGAEAGVFNVLKLCISLVFLGAFLGKLNSNYWSGEVFTHLGFPRFSTSPLLISFFSKAAILTEGLVVLCYFIRSKYSFLISGTLIVMMWIMTDYTIINALGTLLGLALAGILLQHERLFLMCNTKGRAIGLCLAMFAAVLIFEPVAKRSLFLLQQICN